MKTLKAEKGYVLCNGYIYTSGIIHLGIYERASKWIEMTEELAMEVVNSNKRI